MTEKELAAIALVLLAVVGIGEVVGNLLTLQTLKWMARLDEKERERKRAKEQEQ